MSPEWLERLDRARGLVRRGTFVKRAVDQVLDERDDASAVLASPAADGLSAELAADDVMDRLPGTTSAAFESRSSSVPRRAAPAVKQLVDPRKSDLLLRVREVAREGVGSSEPTEKPNGYPDAPRHTDDREVLAWRKAQGMDRFGRLPDEGLFDSTSWGRI